MAGALRKTMIYLGLADGDEHYEPEPKPPLETRSSPWTSPDRSAARSLSAAPVKPAAEEYRAPVTPIKRAPSAREDATVLHQITTVHPRSYNDAKIIGESFRDGIPVIMNVTDMGEAEAKRLVDFSAGLVFGLHGSIERVTNKVFLLSPSSVEVLGEDRKSSEPAGQLLNQS